MNCVFCKGKISISDKVKRSDTCPHCNMDLKCCKQCKLYDVHSYNECREVSAERVIDKERANFCEYFVPRGSRYTRADGVQATKRALEALFKK